MRDSDSGRGGDGGDVADSTDMDGGHGHLIQVLCLLHVYAEAW